MLDAKSNDEWQKLCEEFRTALKATYKPLGDEDWLQFEIAWQLAEDIKTKMSEFRKKHTKI